VLGEKRLQNEGLCEETSCERLKRDAWPGLDKGGKGEIEQIGCRRKQDLADERSWKRSMDRELRCGFNESVKKAALKTPHTRMDTDHFWSKHKCGGGTPGNLKRKRKGYPYAYQPTSDETKGREKEAISRWLDGSKGGGIMQKRPSRPGEWVSMPTEKNLSEGI